MTTPEGYQGTVTGRIVSSKPSIWDLDRHSDYREIPKPQGTWEVDYAWVEAEVLKRLGVSIEYLGKGKAAEKGGKR